MELVIKQAEGFVSLPTGLRRGQLTERNVHWLVAQPTLPEDDAHNAVQDTRGMGLNAATANGQVVAGDGDVAWTVWW